MTSKKILDLYNEYSKHTTQNHLEVAAMLTLAQVIAETGVSVAEIHAKLSPSLATDDSMISKFKKLNAKQIKEAEESEKLLKV